MYFKNLELTINPQPRTAHEKIHAENERQAEVVRKQLAADGKLPRRPRAAFRFALVRTMASEEARERGRALDLRVREKMGVPTEIKSDREGARELGVTPDGRTRYKSVRLPMLSKEDCGMRSAPIRK